MNAHQLSTSVPLDDLTVYALRAAVLVMLFAFFMLEPKSPLAYIPLVIVTPVYLLVESARRARERENEGPDEHP
jgi:hypothetical protein